MKAKIFQDKLFSLMIIFVLSLMACNESSSTKNEKEPEKVAEEKNDAKFSGAGEKDAAALTDAFSSSLFEKELSDSIRAMSTNKQIKGLADSMSMAHAKLNDQMKDLAGKKAISLPATLSSDQYEKIRKIVDKKPSDQTKDYVNELIDGHKNAISLFEKKAAECTDPDIKSWFENTLPSLRHHLDMVQNYKDKLAMK